MLEIEIERRYHKRITKTVHSNQRLTNRDRYGRDHANGVSYTTQAPQEATN